MSLKRKSGDCFVLESEGGLGADLITFAGGELRVKIRNNGIVTGHFHPGDVVATASVKYLVPDATEYKVYKLYAKPPSVGHKLNPGAMLSMECRLFLHEARFVTIESSGLLESGDCSLE